MVLSSIILKFIFEIILAKPLGFLYKLQFNGNKVNCQMRYVKHQSMIFKSLGRWFFIPKGKRKSSSVIVLMIKKCQI